MSRKGGAINVPVTQELLKEAKCAHSRYKRYLEEKKENEKKEKEQSKRSESEEEKKSLANEKNVLLLRIAAAEEQMELGSCRLKEALSTKSLVRSKVIKAEELIDASLKRKRDLNDQLESVSQKLRRLHDS